MQARGAGVIVQQELHELLQKINTPTDSVGLRTSQRTGWASEEWCSTTAAWDPIYKSMRAHLVDDRYRQDSKLVRLDQTADAVPIAFDDGYEATAELLIGADEVNSTVRQLLTRIGKSAEYSGYIAWRGLEREADLPVHLVEAQGDWVTPSHPIWLQVCRCIVILCPAQMAAPSVETRA